MGVDGLFIRKEWVADLTPGPDEPLALTLLKYRLSHDRHVAETAHEGNLTSSYLYGTKLHAPILDLDGAHVYVESTTPGHAHLYLPPMKRWKMYLILWALYVGDVVEMGNFWWSLRRGGTFVRKPGVPKSEGEQIRYSYGMFFKIKEKK